MSTNNRSAVRRFAPLTKTQRTPGGDWQQDKPQRSAFLSSTLGARAWHEGRADGWCGSYSPSDFLVLLATRRTPLPELPEAKLDLMKKRGKEKALSVVTRETSRKQRNMTHFRRCAQQYTNELTARKPQASSFAGAVIPDKHPHKTTHPQVEHVAEDRQNTGEKEEARVSANPPTSHPVWSESTSD
jgi:hypothetical protein